MFNIIDRFKRYELSRYDYQLLLLVIVAAIFGIVVINSAIEDNSAKKQTFGFFLGLFAMLIISFISYRTIASFQWALYAANFLMLLSVPFIGTTINGAKRWIDLGITRFQPSELAKFIMVIFIAKFLSDYKDDISHLKTIVLILGLVALPSFLVFSQPDLSSSMVFVFLVVTCIFIAGIDYKLVLRILGVFVPIFIIMLVYIMNPNQKLLKPYQRNRVMALINPEKYSTSEYYQQQNSIMAIGSGQLTGKGLNNNTIYSVKGANFLSEQQTDFIFAVIGEEMGFIGSAFILIVLFLIIMRCIHIARGAPDLMGKIIASGVAAIFAFQVFINVGVATAIIPNTGLTLPFISYGVTSLTCNMMGVGLVLNVGLQRRRYY